MDQLQEEIPKEVGKGTKKILKLIKVSIAEHKGQEVKKMR